MRHHIVLALGLAAAVWSCGGPPRDADASDGGAYTDRLEAEHAGDAPEASPAATAQPRRPVTGSEVTYGEAGGTGLKGYLATPEGAPDSIPGLIVIHEWWGLNDNIRSMARQLAGEGYAALAVDLYGGEVAETPDRAGQLARSVDEDRARANLRAAYRFLEDRGAARIGSIGWCFGGGWSLQTALLFPDSLDATVIYYGHLVTDPDRLAGLEVPIQGHFGAEDGSIPVDDVRLFGSVLDSLGVAGRMYVYEGAGHAFANPSGTRYVKAAADTAWGRTLAFLREHLEPGG